MASLITLSIPAFFVLIGVELIAARVLRRKVHRLNDALDDLNCGIVSQLPGVFTSALTLGLYTLCFGLGRETLGVAELDGDRWTTWLIALLGIDLAYYWFHRLSHEINFLWAAHVVHHQSEDYNLAVALRQSAVQGYFNLPFYLPLALIGVPPLVYVIALQINTLYQFWIHTRLIGRIGPLEAVLNTPSHHRVHHGADPKYLDRNYAGILIIWDRMFGTFQAEQEEPTYGTTKPLARWNAVWANLDVWAQLGREARALPRWRDRVWLFFAHPGWHPERAQRVVEVRGRARFDADVGLLRKLYLLLQFVGVIAVTVALLFGGKALGVSAKLALSLWITTGAYAIGLGFERRPSFAAIELLRLLALPLLSWWVLAPIVGASTTVLGTAAAAGFVLISGFGYWISRTPPIDPNDKPLVLLP